MRRATKTGIQLDLGGGGDEGTSPQRISLKCYVRLLRKVDIIFFVHRKRTQEKLDLNLSLTSNRTFISNRGKGSICKRRQAAGGQGAGLFLSVLIQMTLIHKKQSQVYNERSTNGRAYRKSERFKK